MRKQRLTPQASPRHPRQLRGARARVEISSPQADHDLPEVLTAEQAAESLARSRPRFSAVNLCSLKREPAA